MVNYNRLLGTTEKASMESVVITTHIRATSIEVPTRHPFTVSLKRHQSKKHILNFFKQDYLLVSLDGFNAHKKVKIDSNGAIKPFSIEAFDPLDAKRLKYRLDCWTLKSKQ